MSTPSWADAPKWATHLAMDSNGAWWWFEGPPVIDRNLGIFCGESRRTEAAYIAKWDQSCQSRTVLPKRYESCNPTLTIADYVMAGWTVDLLLQHGLIREVEG